MDNKIFITLGSQKFQFNRLLKAVDELCERGTIEAADVFAQIGYSDYLPKNFNYKKNNIALIHTKYSMNAMHQKLAQYYIDVMQEKRA